MWIHVAQKEQNSRVAQEQQQGGPSYSTSLWRGAWKEERAMIAGRQGDPLISHSPQTESVNPLAMLATGMIPRNQKADEF